MAFQLHFFSLLVNIVHIFLFFFLFGLVLLLGVFVLSFTMNNKIVFLHFLFNKERIFLEIKEGKNVNKKINSKN